MGFITLATSAGIIIFSTDRLEAAKELALSVVYTEAFASLFMKVGKVGGGVAFILTGVLFMKSDQASPSEAQVMETNINEFIFENYPQLEYRSKEFQEIFRKLKYLYTHPYVFRRSTATYHRLVWNNEEL
jgi:hypothetical protein